MPQSKIFTRKRYHEDGPIECIYPGCGGYIKVDVDNHYGADRDGNRGKTVYDVRCDHCDRDPNEFDEDVWERERCFELLNDAVELLKSSGLGQCYVTNKIEEFLEERNQLED